MSLETIKIAVIDSEEIIRIGISKLINSFDSCIVHLEANNRKDLIVKLADTPIIPNICLFRMNKHAESGYSALKEFRKQWPTLSIIILTVYINEYAVYELIKNGANCCLPVNCKCEELEKAIKSVYEHNHYYSDFQSHSLHHFANTDYYHTPRLSDKEMIFLPYCCTEFCYKEIAEKMGVSLRTVHGYRDSLFEKLKVKSRIKLARFAISMGLVPFNEW